MASPAIRLKELDDEQLEEFIEIWVEKKSEGFYSVQRMGGASDKGRDVVAFLSAAKHEGDWHLYQCKRKTLGVSLGMPEGLAELAKVFYHHVNGAYKTLPTEYVFVAPRGVAGTLANLIENPSTLKAALIQNWDDHCADKIVSKKKIQLTPDLQAAIESYDFSRVRYLNASLIVKDPAAVPALIKLLGVEPTEAPCGVTPETIQTEELEYVGQLRRAYEAHSGKEFASADEVLADAKHGDHLRRQRVRFFDAQAFDHHHRDSTTKEMLDAFQDDVYHGVIEVYEQRHGSSLARVDAVMNHASLLQAGLHGKIARVTVRQGMCHLLANRGRMKWMP